jgi:hypothetical protein
LLLLAALTLITFAGGVSETADVIPTRTAEIVGLVLAIAGLGVAIAGLMLARKGPSVSTGDASQTAGDPRL